MIYSRRPPETGTKVHAPPAELLFSGTWKVAGDGKTFKEKPIPVVVLADRYSLSHPVDFVEGWIAMRESSVSESRSSWNVSHVLVQR
jgi:hypothetical protein